MWTYRTGNLHSLVLGRGLPHARGIYDTRDSSHKPRIGITSSARTEPGPLEKFPLLDPPREDQIREGFKTLRELQAIDDRRQLTPLGRQLGHLPIDPRIGRMILEAHERNCLEEVVVIAAALEAQDPRDRPPDRKEQADQAHLPFQDQRSDFVAFLKVWQFYHLLKAKLSNSQLKKACQQQFLSQVRLREWSDLARQLYTVANVVKRKSQPGTKSKQPTSRDAASEKKPALVINLPPDGSVDDRRYAAIHQSLLTGLLSGVAMAGEKHTYQGAGGLELFLWPGSGVFAGKPKWIVAAELVETSRRYARTVAKIDPEWLEPLAAHLIKRNYSDPHWSKKRYMALCSERLLLFGLPVVAKRLVPLAPVDPESARELLIEHGLVDGELETRARFFQHNQFLQRSLGELAARMRKRELVVDPYTVRRFYFERLPSQCVGRIELEQLDRQLPAPSWTKALSDVDRIAKWLETPPAIPNDAADAAATQLYMRPEDLLPQATAKVAPSDFPETLEVGGCELPLSYNFAPGAPDDGITVKVPAAALAQVSDDRLGWLVPGLLEEKITALIKALPKRIRRNLVPAADVAKRVCKQLTAEQGQTPFMTSVCRQLSALAEMPVQASDFEVDKLPPHVQFLVQVIDDGGQTIASGRSVDELKAQLGATTATSTGEVIDTGPDPAGLTREGLTNFEIDELPELVTRVRGGVKVNLYPALVDTGPNVAVRLFDSPSSAEEATRKGLMRLFVLTERKELRSQVQWLPQREQAQMLLARAFGGRDFNEVMIDLLARLAFVGNEPLARTRDDFEVRRKDRGRRINGASQDLGKWLPEIAQAYHALRLRMESLTHARYAAVMDDVQAQLAGLLSTETFESATWDWLKHIPRYLKGIDYRLDKLRSGGEAKDRANLEVVRNLQVKYEQRRQDTRADLNQLTEVRWLFEELRISLFAQPLGTAHKASPQRIEKMLT